MQATPFIHRGVLALALPGMAPAALVAGEGAFAGPRIGPVPVEFVMFGAVLISLYMTLAELALTQGGEDLGILAYAVGCLVMLALIGFRPGATPKGVAVPAAASTSAPTR